MDRRLLFRPLGGAARRCLNPQPLHLRPAPVAASAAQIRHNASVASNPPPTPERASQKRSRKPSPPQQASTSEPSTLATQSIDSAESEEALQFPSRYPRNVQALYLQPLRRHAEYGVPSCDLQLRSYSIRPLEFFCDFALRAAYYLGLPAFGPVPLPKITERWTVPRSVFIFKKSQENFERITRRRLIQIRDGHPETVQIWLAFLQKHQQYGVGMKANMWEYGSLDVAKELAESTDAAASLIDENIKLMGVTKQYDTVKKVEEMLASRRYKLTGGR